MMRDDKGPVVVPARALELMSGPGTHKWPPARRGNGLQLNQTKRAQGLKYNLRFHKTHIETIILPAPSLFDLTAGTYLILPEAIYAYWSLTQVPEPEPEPPLDPYRQSIYQWDPEEIANQWHPKDPPQYTVESSFDPWA